MQGKLGAGKGGEAWKKAMDCSRPVGGRGSRWAAYLRVGATLHDLGVFARERDAAAAHDEALRRYCARRRGGMLSPLRPANSPNLDRGEARALPWAWAAATENIDGKTEPVQILQSLVSGD